MKEKQVVILGAGISALSFAYYLKKYNPQCDFVILVDEQKSGGLVYSEKFEDAVIEWGPRGVRPKGRGQLVLELVEDLGLWDELIFSNAKAKKRYLWVDGRMQVLPYSLKSLLCSPFLKLFWKAILRDLRSKKSELKDESIASFVDRHFGEDFRKTFFDSLVSGVWAGDVEKMSLKACFSVLKRAENAKGSVIRGMFSEKKQEVDYKLFDKVVRTNPLFSFKGGMQVLIDRLTEDLQGYIQYGESVIRIELSEKVSIETSKGVYLASKCVSTLPAHVMRSLVEGDLSKSLSKIEYVPIALVNLLIPKNAISFDGFGFLIPSKEKSPILGMVANSNTFPEHCSTDKMLCTVMIGGARADLESLKIQDHQKVALDALNEIFSTDIQVEYIDSKLLERGIPQYHIGHLDLLSAIEEQTPNNMKLLGNYLYGVSLIDIISKSKQEARNFIYTPR